MPDQHLDPLVAATYDRRVAERFDPAVLGPTVDVLAELAGDGPALEFAIGTGRVALALCERGVEVHGLELSEPMLAGLRAKPRGGEIPVTVGDMATDRAPGEFALVYLVFNTLGNLTTQAGQLACFRNAAAHLAPGGHFVVEIGVPDPPPHPERLRPFAMTDDHMGIDEYVDRVEQIVVSHHDHPNDPELRRVSGTFRYAWPSELDLMAQLAGMHRVHRWAGWNREPFTDESRSHVSVWRRDDGSVHRTV